MTSFLFASQTRLQPQFKCFTSSSCFLKSAKKKAELKGVADADPFDFSELEGGIEKAHSKLKDDLSKLKPGGRFNPENVENLRVQVIKNSKATERLGTLAQVIPRGRTLNLIVGEKDVRVKISPNTKGYADDRRLASSSNLSHLRFRPRNST